MTVPVTVSWHNEARRRIVPRTRGDLALTEPHGPVSEWSEVRDQLVRYQLTSPDADITAAIAHVKEMEARPKELSPLEMQLAFVIMYGAGRALRFFVREWGPVLVTRALAAPPLAKSWTSATSTFEVKREAKPPDTYFLRRIVLPLDVAKREECRAVVQAIWDAADVADRVNLAVAFLEHDAWRDQALAEVLDKAPALTREHLVLARDVATVRTLLTRRKPTDALEHTELVATLDADALPLLVELAKSATKGLHMPHTLAMSVLVAEEAARHLASCISHPQTRDIIGAYFERNKDLAAAVLPAASQGASRNAALAKALLLKLTGSAATPEAAEITVDIDDPAVPAVLRDAPWRSPPPPLPALALAQDLDAYPLAVTLSEARRAEGLAGLTALRRGVEMTAEEAAAFAQLHAGDSWMWTFSVEGKAVPLDLILEHQVKGRWMNNRCALPLLAHFGARALPAARQAHLLAQLQDDVVVGLDDPRLAYQLAGSHLEGHDRWAWFSAHPRAAALGLLASAHEPDKRHASETMLRRMAREGHAEVILDVAHGDERVRAFLERDPRADVITVSRIDPPSVTRPRLSDGRPLGDEAMRRICEMLALSYVDEPYPGLADVRAACEPRRLAEMAWDLAALADGGGRASRARSSPSWMRFAVAHFGDDEVIRRLTPALKHRDVYRVLESLTIRGVRSAAMELATAHERGDAPDAIARVARAFGKTADELVETILPTTPLEQDGTTTLKFGSRSLRVGFDTTLAPILFDGEKRLASLPRAKKDDDPVAVRLAREHWEELKEDVRTIASLRARSLEDAMRSARAIPRAHFLAAWVGHPLGQHNTRGMVWAVLRGGALVTFRVAEDGTFADAKDEPFTLEPAESVRVPHLAEMAPDDVSAWLQTFGDYGLIQPVAQLARTPVVLQSPIKPDWTGIQHQLRQPTPYRVLLRAAADYRARRRDSARGPGMGQLDWTTKWSGRESLVEAVKLSFMGQDDKPIEVGKVDPVELAEGLYMLRMMLEAT